MKRVRLRFENIQQVVGSDDVAVIQLTDMSRERAISIVCDERMTQQFMIRMRHPELCRTFLPEALSKMLEQHYELMVYGLHDGQYQTVLSDTDFNKSTSIRMSDAVLLSMITGYPMYIEETLFLRQSNAFDENAKGIAIPINTMDRSRLNIALQRAINEENYELASRLRNEIRQRSEEKKDDY